MIYQGSCHCGHIAFEVEGDLYAVKQCNCSICSRLGALRWFVPRSQVRFITPESNLSTYQFGKKRISSRWTGAVSEQLAHQKYFQQVVQESLPQPGRGNTPVIPGQ
jgi:hypothetical protein